MPVLEVKNLCKSFDKNTPVLRGIDFSLERGEAAAIIGSSGSGKTTLLRCLNFLTEPDQGSICVNGETLFCAGSESRAREQEIRKKRLHFGLVFQNFNLFPQYTALQNVMLAPELLAQEQPNWRQNRRAVREALREKAETLLRQVGMGEKMGLYPHQLSGGQQQRVAIARAIATRSPIIMADEPTGALDSRTGAQVLDILRSLHKSGTTVILITHDNGIAAKAGRIIRLQDGHIIEDRLNRPDECRAINENM